MRDSGWRRVGIPFVSVAIAFAAVELPGGPVAAGAPFGQERTGTTPLDDLKKHQKTESPGRTQPQRKGVIGDDTVAKHAEAARDLGEARKLVLQSDALFRAGKYAEAIPLAEKARKKLTRALGPSHELVGAWMTQLALFYMCQGDYATAASIAKRAVTVLEKAHGPDHVYVAMALSQLAQIHIHRGDLAAAELLCIRAGAILERALGPESDSLALAHANLGHVYTRRGDFAKAEPLLERSLAVLERSRKPDDLDVASARNSLGLISLHQGLYAKAEQMLLRARTAFETKVGPDHIDVVESLTYLGLLYTAQGDYARAEPLFVRSLAITEKTRNPEGVAVARALTNLGLLYAYGGVYAKAEPLLARARAALERDLGARHPSVATSLSLLGLVALYRGDVAAAEPLLRRALEIREAALGRDHPDVAIVLKSLAVLALETGDVSRAVDLVGRVNEISERNLVANLVAGSEREKLLYLATTAREQDITLWISAQLAPDDAVARRRALEVVIRRKGRALDAMSDAFQVLRRNASAENRALLDELADVRARLSALNIKGPGASGTTEHREALGALDARTQRLEADISARSREYRARFAAVSLDAVAEAVPASTLLVEFAAYAPYDLESSSYGARRYVVYVMDRSGAIASADLGEAAKIDDAVTALRAVLRDPKADPETVVKPRARALDELVMRPVRRLTGDVVRLLVSPDGALNLVPFDALVDEEGRYLVERFEISYLTSGRDLLRLSERGESREPARVFADPDFGPRPGDTGRRGVEFDAGDVQASASSVLARAYFPPLAGTAAEAAALRTVLPEARVVTGGGVTKAALVGLEAPRILHVATHGFFLNAAPPAPRAARGVELAESAKVGPVASVRLENPLLRSGLALAGANLHRGGDGILTAMEASGLDLWGTKLVVLSACDTGVGDVKPGDGVYGLRRALVLAGSETQVMSLWPVSDEGTRDLMVAYYTALVAGEGRATAMRRVRLAMLSDPARRHPFFWASFMVSGEWANLAGRR